MPPDKNAAQPATEKASGSGRGIRYPGEVADLLDVEMPHVCQIFGQPENEEEPRGVGQKLCPDQGPHLPITEQA
jgi:hypothetical protein